MYFIYMNSMSTIKNYITYHILYTNYIYGRDIRVRRIPKTEQHKLLLLFVLIYIRKYINGK